MTSSAPFEPSASCFQICFLRRPRQRLSGLGGIISLPLAALFGLVFQWGIFWVYVGIMAEQFVKFGIGLYRLRSREWINDVTQFSTQEKEAAP